MAIVNPIILALKECTLIVGTDDYSNAVKDVIITESHEVLRWNGMTPSARFAAISTPDHALTMTFAQDWVTEKSLSRLMFAGSDVPVTMKFYPKAGANLPAFTVQVLLVPTVIGGTTGTIAEATVELPVIGKPVLL